MPEQWVTEEELRSEFPDADFFKDFGRSVFHVKSGACTVSVWLVDNHSHQATVTIDDHGSRIYPDIPPTLSRIRALVAALGGDNEDVQLMSRALSIISDAIVHGMPVTPDVADVRNGIVKRIKEDTDAD